MTEFRVFAKKFRFGQFFSLVKTLDTIMLFGQNSIFSQNFDCLPKCRVFPKFRFLANSTIFAKTSIIFQNFDYLQKLRLFCLNLYFLPIFNFLPKLRFFVPKFICFANLRFFAKICDQKYRGLFQTLFLIRLVFGLIREFSHPVFV